MCPHPGYKLREKTHVDNELKSNLCEIIPVVSQIDDDVVIVSQIDDDVVPKINNKHKFSTRKIVPATSLLKNYNEYEYEYEYEYSTSSPNTINSESSNSPNSLTGSISSIYFNNFMNSFNLENTHVSDFSEYTNKKKFMTRFVKRDGMTLQYMCDDIKNDFDVVYLAVSNNSDALQFSPCFKNSKILRIQIQINKIKKIMHNLFKNKHKILPLDT
jgi:hypothetical protein